jgi:actin related protein 2/3 complex subunit 4
MFYINGKQKKTYLYFIRSSKQLLLNPVVISRNQNERILIEGSVNSVRISIGVKQVKIISIFFINSILIFFK